MNISIYITLVGLVAVGFVNCVDHHKIQVINEQGNDFGDIEIIQNDLNVMTNRRECICVPYYRCDPGHWEKTENDHCKRFMYICCYGDEAIEYMNMSNQESDSK